MHGAGSNPPNRQTERVPLVYFPGKPLEAARASLHAAHSVLGGQVPFYHIPKVGRSAMDATKKGTTVVLVDVLEHS